MILNFCTLFDRNYLYKGITMYQSLAKHCSSDFILWILCMDDVTYKILDKLCLSHVQLISLSEFESQELLAVKPSRSVGEYAWTCASNLIWFILTKKTDIAMVIYLDADLYFFADPEVLIKELGNDDVMITEHRYTKKYDQMSSSGKYCVQFMIFRNTNNSLIALDWWRKACLEWCFSYLDNGRFGDQKYLDDWLQRFTGIHELQHLGGGVAPWNVQQYHFNVNHGNIFGKVKRKNNNWRLIFYHFHSFCLISDRKYFSTRGYDLSRQVKKIIYDPYFKSLQDSIALIEESFPDFSSGYKNITIKEKLVSWLSKFSLMRLLIRFYKLINK